MNKIEQILVLLLFLPVLHVMAEDNNNGLMLDKFNANGSLVADKSRGIAYITYDLNNNPKQIYFTNGSVTKYIYSASGQKLRVVHYTAKPNISRTWGVKPVELTASQILQADSTDYMLGGSLTLKNGKIDRYLFDGGYAQATVASATTDNFAFYYYNQDHLGNIREVVDKGHYEKGLVHKNGVPDPTFKMQKESANWNKTTSHFKDYQDKVIKQHGW